jgi:hypothetical protein
MNRRMFIQAAATTVSGLTVRVGISETNRSVEELLKWLEESRREDIPHDLGRMILAGLGYENLLAALCLAAVLPIVWAADYFKDTQAQERGASGWRLPRRTIAWVGDREVARRALVTALDSWDRDAADAAIVRYAQAAPVDEIFSVLFAYGARDLRAIGHKAITVSNAHSLVALLGSVHVEPLLRSTVAALQNSEGGLIRPITTCNPIDRGGKIISSYARSRSPGSMDTTMRARGENCMQPSIACQKTQREWLSWNC